MDTVVCIASGPSLLQSDIDFCRGKAKVFVVNDVYKLAPWADVLYSCDFDWWSWQEKHHKKEIEAFEGEKWTISKDAARAYNINLIGYVRSKKFSTDPSYIVTGGNSGFQALNLAVLRGFKRVVLLGYDMSLAKDGKRHFFGDHPKHMDKKSDYASWAEKFEAAAPLIDAEVVNCTRRTALTCFNRAKLEDVL
jgi:hypothetical protein